MNEDDLDALPVGATDARYWRTPKTPEWVSEQMRQMLFEARQIAIQHRDELLDQGFGRDDANHVATGALYDLQSNMLRALWPDE